MRSRVVIGRSGELVKCRNFASHDMSGAARRLTRLALQFSRQKTAKRKPQCRDWRIPVNQLRPFSSAPIWLEEEKNSAGQTPTPDTQKQEVYPKTHYLTIEDLEDDARAEFDRASPEEQQEWREGLRALSEVDDTASFTDELDAMEEDITRDVEEIDRETPFAFPEHRPNKNNAGFWADEEHDELGQVFDDDDDFQADDMTTTAHAQLDLHRDMREYQRRIAWDMPLLSSMGPLSPIPLFPLHTHTQPTANKTLSFPTPLEFAQKFEPPPLTSPLRFRYTTYMGEEHPAAKKVVVEFCPSDLPQLTAPQHRNKLIKLAGVRYNPSRDAIKISCEKFETQAQNKRYLGDLVSKMVDEATDPHKDSFEDVPFDFRHHKPKVVHQFPEEWKLGSEERVRALVEGREKRRSRQRLWLEEGDGGGERAKTEVVDGDSIVREYVAAVTAFQARQPNLPPGVGKGRRQIAR